MRPFRHRQHGVSAWRAADHQQRRPDRRLRRAERYSLAVRGPKPWRAIARRIAALGRGGAVADPGHPARSFWPRPYRHAQ